MFQQEEKLRFPHLVAKTFKLKQPPQAIPPPAGRIAPPPSGSSPLPQKCLCSRIPPRTPAAGVSHRFYVFILDGGASRPPSFPRRPPFC